MKHKHAELIKAYADGAEIEYKDVDGCWYLINNPVWHNHFEYRIKPEPQKEQEPQYLYVYNDDCECKTWMSPELIRYTDGWVYMGKVRLEK